MSSFTFSPDVVLRCSECSWTQLERHFAENRECLMCSGVGEEVGEIDNSGPSFKEKRLLREVDAVDGVGQATASNLRDAFSVQEFIDACRKGYEEANTSELEAVSGVGKATASAIAGYVGEQKDWEQQQFSLVA